MAKKNPKNAERKALVEKMRQEQARKERQRSMLILGACVVVVAGLLAAALIPYINDQREKNHLKSLALDKLGAVQSAASCDPVMTQTPQGQEVSGVNGNHVTIGTKITYRFSPPAFGQHWPNFLNGTERRNFWSPDDRPDLERVVHSLEHGHTIYWYDDTITPGSTEYKDLQAIADKFSDDPYFNISPWKSSDGGAFPSGKHVALTHWTGSGSKQAGVWEYCGKPSGEAVKSFTTTYPSSNAPEAGAP